MYNNNHMSLLSNFDIKDICDFLELPLVAITMKDKLPPKKNAPIGYYIINMESSTDGGSGSHWVCLCNIPDRRFYFDSFGNGPPQLIEKWIAGEAKQGKPEYIGRSAIPTATCSYPCLT